jgi:NAD(P)-dependent dehydrogenase (short-subunit alcohol dehydrogenase family)
MAGSFDSPTLVVVRATVIIYPEHQQTALTKCRATGDCTRSPPEDPFGGEALDNPASRRRGKQMSVFRRISLGQGVLALLLLGISAPAWAVPSPDAPTVFITGSNRGLGLEFARQYAALGWNVIATCRNPDAAGDLQALAEDYPQVIIDRLDVTEQDQVDAIAEKFADQPIDVLLNNAGIWGSLDEQSFGTFDYEEHDRVYNVNALGPLRVTQALLPNVEAGQQKKIIGLGGGMGTRKTVERAPGGHYWYRMSRAANLISMAILQREVRNRGIIIAFISPGKVDTQMLEDSGWPSSFKSLSPKDSARYVIERIAALTADAGGELINYDGQVIGW